jgi:hypothetical protein
MYCQIYKIQAAVIMAVFKVLPQNLNGRTGKLPKFSNSWCASQGWNKKKESKLDTLLGISKYSMSHLTWNPP